MNKILSLMIVLTLTAGLTTKTMAKSEREDEPKLRLVEETLEALGDPHCPEKMRIKRITSIAIGDTHYHIFQGKLDTTGYHVIVYDNYQNYLGYYPSDFPPCNEEREGYIVLDSGDVDENGDAKFIYIPVDPESGVHLRVQIGSKPANFVKAPEQAGGAKKTAGKDGVVPEYREWNIIHKGKKIPVRAIYVDQTFAKVILKAEASGTVKEFDITSLSKEDQAYIEQFK